MEKISTSLQIRKVWVTAGVTCSVYVIHGRERSLVVVYPKANLISDAQCSGNSTLYRVLSLNVFAFKSVFQPSVLIQKGLSVLLQHLMLLLFAADFGVSAKNVKTLQKRDSFIGTPYW